MLFKPGEKVRATGSVEQLEKGLVYTIAQKIDLMGEVYYMIEECPGHLYTHCCFGPLPEGAVRQALDQTPIADGVTLGDIQPEED